MACCPNHGCNSCVGCQCKRCQCGCQRPKKSCCDCKTTAISGCPAKSENLNCEWYPVYNETTGCGPDRPLRICCDQNGCCGLFPEACRNTFWPDFAHPRWLCCQDLYCAAKKAPCNKPCPQQC